MAPHPARRLADAAIEYAAAVEAEGPTRREWDRLRKAAIYYRDTPRPMGRPRLHAATARDRNPPRRTET
jgi:hypothetical protein